MYLVENFKNNNYQIRGVAVLAVILIHVLSASSNKFFPGANMLAVYALDGLLKFAVPLFIISSVFFLFGKSESSQNDNYYHYLIKKIKTRLVPIYVVSSILYFYFFNYISGANRGLNDLLSAIILNNAAYHLWYLYLMMGIYLFFPIIVKLMRKLGRDRLIWSFIIQAVSMLLLSFLLHRYGIKNYPEVIVSSFFIFFLIYIAIGYQLYFYRDFFVSKKCIFFSTMILIFLLIIYALIRRYFLTLSPEIFRGVLVYSMFSTVITIFVTLICLVCVTYYISKLPRLGLLDRLFVFCGKNSLTIYIIHVLFVEYIFSFLNKYSVPVTNLMYYVVTFILSIVGSLSFAWIVSKTTKLTKNIFIKL